MAILSNINGKFAVESTGAIQFNGSNGTAGYILKSNGNASPTWVAASTVIGGPYLPLSGGTLTGATATSTGISFTVGGALTVDGNIVGATGNTTEVGTYSTGAIKRIRMSQGGEIHFGDTTTTNALGITEGAWDNFSDQDRIGLYCRNELKIYGNSNLLKVTIPTSGNSTFAEGATFGGNVVAPTFNGLAINTSGTNNVANQIVRTDVYGYVNFGWIQSTSGATTSTITRITASDDQYLRYVTPATFRTQITDPYYAPATGGSYLPLAGGTMTGSISMGTQNFAVAANYGRGVFGLYSSTKFQHLWGMGTAYKLPDDGSTTGNLYGVAWSYPSAGGAAANLSDHGMLLINNGLYRAAISNSIRCVTDMRTPIYYDSDNTAYYGDFSSYTYGKYYGRIAHNEGFQVGGYNNVGGNHATSNPIYTIGSSYMPAVTTLSNMYGVGYTGVGSTFINFTGASDWGFYVAADGDARVWLDGSSGNISTAGNTYAASYYDYNNTAYYGDFANSTWALNTAGSLKIIGGVGSDGDGASTVNEAVRVSMPNGASYSIDGGVTGAFKIRLPVRANNTMWSMKVRIYYYSPNYTSEYTIGNYSYDSGGYNSSASFQGAAGMAGRQVRWGNDGSYDCVWIGETSSTWNYPVVSVMDFQGGFRSGNATTWTNNWDISLVTSFGTVQTAYYPSTQVGSIGYASDSFRAPIFYDSNNTAYFGDFGGTYSNISKLKITANWGSPSGVSPDDAQIQIRGTYPSMTFRSTNSNKMWLRHMDAGGEIQHYYAAGTDSTAWSIKHTMKQSGTFESQSSLRAPIFYDLNNTGYYVDPASTSNLNIGNFQSTAAASVYATSHVRIGSGPQSLTGLNLGTDSSIYMIQSTYSSGAYYKVVNDTATPIRIRHQVSSFDTSAYTDSIVIFNHNYWRGYVGILRSPEYPLDLAGQARLSGGYTTSDARLKENIRDNTVGLTELLQLRTRVFDWITDREILGRTLAYRSSLMDCRGFIAQEAELVAPDLVDSNEEGDGCKSIDEGAVTAMLVKAIQEQQVIIDDLKLRIENLENN